MENYEYRAETVSYIGATMTARFENLIGRNHTLADIVVWLAYECVRAMGEEPSLEYGQECLEMTEMFFEVFDEGNDDIYEMIDECFGGMPFVFEIANNYYDNVVYPEFIAECSKIKLGKKQAHNAKLLTDYIVNTRAERSFSFISENFSGSIDMPQVVPKELIKEYAREYYTIIKYLVSAKCNGGAAIFRYHQRGKGYDVINGFDFEDGQIKIIPIDELKRCTETQPDGTKVTRSSERCEEAAIEFKK